MQRDSWLAARTDRKSSSSRKKAVQIVIPTSTKEQRTAEAVNIWRELSYFSMLFKDN